MKDIFYNVSELTLRQRINVMKLAKEKANKWWVDELDCTNSFQRQKIDMSFEDIIKKFKEKSHFVIINRHGEYGEIGFCTLKELDYFLWINISIEILEEIIKKFNLKKR